MIYDYRNEMEISLIQGLREHFTYIEDQALMSQRREEKPWRNHVKSPELSWKSKVQSCRAIKVKCRKLQFLKIDLEINPSIDRSAWAIDRQTWAIDRSQQKFEKIVAGVKWRIAIDRPTWAIDRLA